MGIVQTQDGNLCFMGSGDDGSEGSITAEGTDGSEATGSRIVFKSAEDSNVVVTVSEGEEGEIVAEVGVYYK